MYSIEINYKKLTRQRELKLNTNTFTAAYNKVNQINLILLSPQ